MAKTIRDMGISAYLDDVYASEGGSKRIKDMIAMGRPRQKIMEVFKVSRPALNHWIKLLEEEAAKK